MNVSVEMYEDRISDGGLGTGVSYAYEYYFGRKGLYCSYIVL